MFDEATVQLLLQWGGFGIIAILFGVLLRYVLRSHEARISEHMETNRRAWSAVEELSKSHSTAAAAIVGELGLINQRIANSRPSP